VRVLVATVLAAAGLVTSCGTSATYGVDETQDAFEQHGYVLYEGSPPTPAGADLNPYRTGNPTILLPRGDAPFFVFIGAASDTERVWSMYQSQQGAGTFDARRANVLVISDSGLSAADRKRVRAALGSLPDRGSPVHVAPAG
jgi:hypothetical protein